MKTRTMLTPLALSLALTACATTSGDGGDAERDALFEAELQLQDAIDLVDEESETDTIVEAEAMPGLEGIEYEIVAVDGEETVTYTVDGASGELLDVARGRAIESRRIAAARMAAARLHLARRIEAALGDDRRQRARRAWFQDDRVDVELVDRG